MTNFLSSWKKNADIYEGSSLTPQSEKLFLQLQEHVTREAEYMKHLMEIEGMLHILLASATMQQETASNERYTSSKGMIPSVAAVASANLVYNIS